jgi:rare lipoprotein A
MIRKIIFCLVLFLLSCSPSPRYTSENIIYGVASHYGHNDGFDGQLTANGEIFDQHGLSAAHKTLPLNSWIKVTNLDRLTRPSVKLKVNDRGPYVGDRVLDCSSAAAKKLGFFEKGTAKVKIEVIKWGDNKYYKSQ